MKGVTSELLDTEPSIQWTVIARMRDHLAHRYFDTDHAVVVDVVENELKSLEVAVTALAKRANAS